MELGFNAQGMKIKVVEVIIGFFVAAMEGAVAVIPIAITTCYC